MDFKSLLLLLILSISSLLISSNAVRVPQSHPTSAHVEELEITSSEISRSPVHEKYEEGRFTEFVTADVVNPALCAENPNLCYRNISEFLKHDPLIGLEIEVDGIRKFANNVANIIANSLKKPYHDKMARDVLYICKSKYGYMVHAIKEALELIEQQNIVDAYHKFNSVISCRTSCDDATNKSPGVRTPFAMDSVIISVYADKILEIMYAIINHSRV